ncbi:MAG: trypsin-like serine protease [Ruminococcaceae bacterium]|nr:trypsin-like serine protease [Oscillospiraceae bacterium]
MSKKIYFLLALALMLCCMLISCTTEEIDHEHNYIERTFKPSCLEDGRHEKICTVCDDIILIEVLPAKGHSPNDWQVKVEPTCLISKVEERICKDCGVVVETNVHKQIGHDPGDWQIITDASCSQNLLEGKVCRVCAAVVETRTGEKIRHEFSEIKVDGNCAVSEHYLYTCKYCGFSYRDNYAKERPPHDWESEYWIVDRAPTCSSEGLMHRICKVCSGDMGESKIAPIDINNHRYVVETIPPTDGEKGQVRNTCKDCGYTIAESFETNFMPSQIYEMIASSTVRIEAMNKDGVMHSVGSGFFINDQGEIVTNYHVIAGAYQLKVKLYGGTEYAVVAVKGYDIVRDIAILRIELTGNPFLKISTSSVKTGDPVYALGSPLGLDDVFTDGVVSSPSKTVNGQSFIVFTAPVAAGNSGGPLVNAHGEVIGINTQVVEDGQNLNLAIDASAISSLDTSVEKSVYDTYVECLNVSGINALAYYIMVQKKDQATIDGEYILSYVLVEEEEGKYGRTFEVVYDREEKCVFLRVNWVSGGRYLYTVELKLDGAKTVYEMRFFDHVWSQYTAAGTIAADVQVTSLANGAMSGGQIDKIMTFDYINYGANETGTLTSATAKQLIGVAYVHILGELGNVLEESNTELNIGHFNFKELILPEEK